MAKNLVVFAVLLLCHLTSAAARKPKNNFRSGTGSTRRPNIVFILADDLDSELGSPNVMTKMHNILRQEGADFVNAFVTTPMCCPSRASILTGSYAHNHNTFTNNLNCSSQSWRKGPEKKSYARYLQLSGYVTGYFGKYLNEYDGSWVPVGWNRWEGLLHNSKFYNYTLRHNTYKERHKMSYEQDYFTDLITNRSISFIRRSKAAKPHSPFLAVVSHSAPHGPETAAPQYSNAFPNAQAPRYDNWNFISMDKQWILRETSPMDAQKIAFVDLLHRRRLQTLLSVDDSIQRIFRTLQSLGIENETYIFFTSDHGYHLGQFGLVKGKSMPFESDIRVPFYVRGPIIPKNIRMKDMVLNIDLAPTFLDIAGMKIPKDMDGTSVMRLFRKPRAGRRAKRRTHVLWRDTILIERSRGWKRTKSLLEGRSKNKTMTAKERKMTVLERICSRPKYQSPCQPNQLWECVTVDRRPRLRKCRRNATLMAKTTPTTRPTTSTLPTTPVKMCVCMKPKPGTEMYENQSDMLPTYDDKLIVSGIDYLTRELRRRSKRTRHSSYSSKKKANEFNAKRYQKELARALKLQNRRANSKVLIRTPDTNTKPESNATGTSPESFGVQEAVEEKLGKLKEKIQEIRMRLGALRDRRKKLLLISARDRYIEYPCPCNHGNDTMLEKATTENVGNGAYDHGADKEDENSDDAFQISPLRRRNKPPKATSRKTDTKKKKVKPRRSKCASPGMNCFYQTNDHWKLPPLWTGGEFCFCPNAANNSYWCLRTINATHNFLYCEFITQFYEYFDLNKDPYQLYNVIDEVSPAVLLELHQQLARMRGCKGEHCTHYHGKKYPQHTTSQPATTKASTTTVQNTRQRITDMTHSPTLSSNMKTPSESSASTLTTERPSEDLVNRSKVVVNTPGSADNTTESSEDLLFTTSAPTEAILETVEQSTGEKPPENTVIPVTGADDVSTVLVKSSEPDASSLETNVSSILPTSASSEENTSEMNLKESFKVKPTRGKAPKRRKNGERENRKKEDTSMDKETQRRKSKNKSSVKERLPLPTENTKEFEEKETKKTSKKPRKAKKKSSENESSLTTLNTGSSAKNKQAIKTAQNQTRVESNKEVQRPESENKGNEKGIKPLPDTSRKRNKKPSSKRNSKKRSKQKPSKRQKPSQISEGGVAQGGVEPTVNNGAGFSLEQESSPPSP